MMEAKKAKGKDPVQTLCDALFCAACLPFTFKKPSAGETLRFKHGMTDNQNTWNYMMAVQNEDELHTLGLYFIPADVLRQAIDKALGSIWDDGGQGASKKLTALRDKLDNMEKNSTATTETK